MQTANLLPYSISDRATHLAYEAKRYPDKAPMALRWLELAQAWAEREGLKELADFVTDLLSPFQNQEAGQE